MLSVVQYAKAETFNGDLLNFSIGYHTGWKVNIPSENIVEFKFRQDDKTFPETFIIFMQRQSPLGGLRQYLTTAQMNGMFTQNNTILVQPVEFTKYKVDGHEAGSVILSNVVNGTKIKTLEIISEIGGHTMTMMYLSDAERFEQGLALTVQPMVSSFKWNFTL